jgi:glycosyltransferase involved in cell wall biosynthesis
MTETISSIISPVTKMLGIKHYLWYAHTSKPFRLIWCHFFVNKIVTSTFQSCPIQSEKIVAIGQTVKNEDFECKNRPEPILRDHFNAIHVGRIDPSKNIDLIIEIFLKNFPEEKSVLHLVGSPTQKAFNYFNELLKLYEQQIRSKKIIFHGSLNQNEIKDLLCFSDVFLHAFQGSLDKSLLEAVFSKIFVISVNSGFRDEFSCLLPNENVISPVEYFESEIRLFKSIPWLEVQKLIDVRYEIAIEKHSRKKWITNLNQVLMESTQ